MVGKIEKIFGEESVDIDYKLTRKEGYGFIFDYQCFDVIANCKNCHYSDDIEHFIITKKRKIIPLTCPICYQTNIEIKDERF